MLYQLSNGKTINISIDEFLSMTDNDIQDMIALGKGFYSNPRSTSFTYEDVEPQDEPELIDYSLLVKEDEEDVPTQAQIRDILNNLSEED